jgi:hypothetical protein
MAGEAISMQRHRAPWRDPDQLVNAPLRTKRGNLFERAIDA